MFTEEEIELLVHCLGLYVAEVDLETEERQEARELIEKMENAKPQEKDDFIGGALLHGIKYKLFQCIETLKSKDASLEAICLMLKKEPSPEDLKVIEAVLSGAEIMDSTHDYEYIQSHLAHYWKIFQPLEER